MYQTSKDTPILYTLLLKKRTWKIVRTYYNPLISNPFISHLWKVCLNVITQHRNSVVHWLPLSFLAIQPSTHNLSRQCKNCIIAQSWNLCFVYFFLKRDTALILCSFSKTFRVHFFANYTKLPLLLWQNLTSNGGNETNYFLNRSHNFSIR